ncbi:MAG: SPOR domain-containing protein [Bacteroidales bacterium]|nr:SPOR domain-containing protein [Bacteroidales bacterium]
MKRCILPLMAVALFVVNGCDFFRTLAGRPTSEDIENRRIEIMKAEEAALQARLDSLRLQEQMVQDSLEALESIRQSGGSILNPASLGGLFATKLEARYYVIIGAFRTRSNAEALLLKAKDSGYAPALINFRGGLTAVGVCPVDKVQDAVEALYIVKQEQFCPSDVWILVNE